MEIFRKSALEKLSSPEQLDLMMTVTSPRGWIAVWAIGGLLIFTLFWSIFGEIPDKVAGSGIMIRGGAVYDVVALGVGRVAELKVKPGDMVAAGDVVALVSSPELQLRVSNFRKELEKLVTEDEALTKGDDRLVELEIEANVTERENLARAKQEALKMVGFLEQKVATQETLVEKGVLTKTNLLSTRNEMITAQQEVARTDQTVAGARARIERQEQRAGKEAEPPAGNRRCAPATERGGSSAQADRRRRIALCGPRAGTHGGSREHRSSRHPGNQPGGSQCQPSRGDFHPRQRWKEGAARHGDPHRADDGQTGGIRGDGGQC